MRAIRHAEAGDVVARNVAALVRPPAGRRGRPSKALSVEQAQALIRAAAAGPYRLHAYVVLLLTTGIRPEEARALPWDHLDLEAGTIAVWRSDRAGGDTKTAKSRRTLKLPQMALAALRLRKAIQNQDRLQAGEIWHDGDLVFTTAIGTMLDQHNIRREFRQITRAASAETILPEFQQLEIGQVLGEEGMTVRQIEPGRHLVLAFHHPKTTWVEKQGVWPLFGDASMCLQLKPLRDGHRTRLVYRMRFSAPPLARFFIFF